MRRPRCVSSTSFFRRSEEIIVASSTKSVVVLMPPAVDPGAPPVNMSATSSSRPVSLIVSISTVLNPAVRGVTAWKSEAQNRAAPCSSGNSSM